MALIASSRSRSEQLQSQAMARKCRESEPTSKLSLHGNGETRSAPVPVIYYLSRNGQLEHPHFMEVSSSSSRGILLRDVINRLNFLRGTDMASRYSWSAKRSYKNGFVWHDLEENDQIQPVHGHEYILKGSEIRETSTNSSIFKPHETASSSGTDKHLETTAKSDGLPVKSRRRNQSCGNVDFAEYKVSDASTQTDEKRRRRRQGREENEAEPAKANAEELSRDEISPPPSDSSPETLESLMKVDGSAAIQAVDRESNPTAGGGKLKPSSVLMSLISCGSVSFREGRAPGGENLGAEEARSTVSSVPSSRFAALGLEDKDYFSGSLA